MTARKARWTRIVIPSALLLGAAVCCLTGQPRPHDFGTMPRTPEAQKALVRRLLTQKLRDDKNFSARATAAGSHMTQLVPQKAWDRLYPVKYAEAVLISYGDDAVDPLLRTMTDPEEDDDIRCAAAYVLAKFDDPRILEAYLEASKRSLVSPSDLAWAVSLYLPVNRTSPHLTGDRITEWLEEQVRKGYAQAVLELLDQLLRADGYANGGTYEGDLRIVRWLNRMHDVDLDIWLSENSPRALAFRKAQLAKGYDPATAMRVFRINLRNGIIDEGIRVVFSRPQDRVACRQLIETVYDVESPLYPPAKDGWENRLKAWYFEHRDHLAYDSDGHRFVVRGGDTLTSRPASAPAPVP